LPSCNAILLISCPDQTGIIAKVSSLLFNNGCNIIDSDQHTDAEDGHFFWRLSFDSTRVDISGLRDLLSLSFPALFPELELKWELFDSGTRQRIVIMVSRLGHCMIDLLSRHHSNELDAEIVSVISNHPDLEPLASPFGVPFAVIPVKKENKQQAETKLLKKLTEHRCDSLVLARYMQVLSGDFLKQWRKPIINIHHSFLPAFVGAKPHKQARERGVKLIGATAHYVTEDLDAGPIISQGTATITHRDNLQELARKGKDVEVVVLAKAVRAHLQHRVLVHHNRTIVFE
jgi:formyltetrahydrofolate deformylase